MYILTIVYGPEYVNHIEWHPEYLLATPSVVCNKQGFIIEEGEDNWPLSTSSSQLATPIVIWTGKWLLFIEV